MSQNQFNFNTTRHYFLRITISTIYWHKTYSLRTSSWVLGSCNTCVRLQSRVTISGATINSSMILFYFYFCYVLLLLLLFLACLLISPFKFVLLLSLICFIYVYFVFLFFFFSFVCLFSVLEGSAFFISM